MINMYVNDYRCPDGGYVGSIPTNGMASPKFVFLTSKSAVKGNNEYRTLYIGGREKFGSYYTLRTEDFRR